MPRDLQAEQQVLSRLPTFFVGGLPRSGTTWVQQLLNAHPQVVCLGESHFFNDLAPSLARAAQGYAKRRSEGHNTWAPTVRGPGTQVLTPVYRAAFVALVQENLDGRDPKQLVTIGEKTPDNIMLLHRVWAVFPSARFINVIRDGRDGAVSAYIRFRSKLPETMTQLDYARAYGEGWAKRIREARELAKGRRYLEVRYEDLHADGEAEAARLFAFLGADSGPDSVRRAIETASFEKLSGGRSRGQEDPASHYRRGEVGGWAEVLTPAEVEAFEAAAGPMMDTLGYARAADRAKGS
ncbi:hypothetical protein GCM10017083_38450 [Thalassobaculum fulvum]|uniref:Sulfotransferase n=1 Tax=Thalassobaculum fulvum TaxID=1633335 RepID=A0A919CRE5_9PROT|nr:sulfotransferase [Thalassobaculum fulvum]GHD57241.1 hypothetical protein GCM10017083_38450 [Thalassobaculum fulvum]